MNPIFRIFGIAILVTVGSLITGFFYGGWPALFVLLILGVLEVSLSFDNAVVNARVLERMSEFWQKIFLTVGILIAVFGMRFLLPLVLVSITTGLSFGDVISLALEKGNPETPGTYGFYLTAAHPLIAAFGGLFLLMLFLDFIFEKRDITWLSFIERPLARIGNIEAVSFIVSLLVLLGASFLAHSGEERLSVLIAGILGIVTYLGVNGLASAFENTLEDDEEDDGERLPGIHGEADDIGQFVNKHHVAPVTKVVGRAAFFLFLYLEVLDASFSFDGVIGAFAITTDPILIALGLGLIGAMFVRSITIFLVRQGTLNEYVYLDHGAHWAIGALAVLLLVSIGVEVPQVVTGLIGAVLIIAAFATSVQRNKREAAEVDA